MKLRIMSPFSFGIRKVTFKARENRGANCALFSTHGIFPLCKTSWLIYVSCDNWIPCSPNIFPCLYRRHVRTMPQTGCLPLSFLMNCNQRIVSSSRISSAAGFYRCVWNGEVLLIKDTFDTSIHLNTGGICVEPAERYRRTLQSSVQDREVPPHRVPDTV